MVCFPLLACTPAYQMQLSESEQTLNITDSAQEIPAIVFGAKLPQDHQDVSDIKTCMECHAIKTDSVTTATQRYLEGEGEKIDNEQLWQEIKIFFGHKQSCVLATSINNIPFVTTLDVALDPVDKLFYALSEKGTRKLEQIRMNPPVALEFHNQEEWKSNIFRCLQMEGDADVFDSDDPRFEKGLTVFRPDTSKISIEIIKRGMDMTCFTPREILFYDVLRKSRGENPFQLWQRKSN